MPRLPGWLLTHTAAIELLTGQTGNDGPVFDPPVSARCFVDRTRKLVRDAERREVVAETTLYFAPDVTITPGSRVTVDGRTSHAITVTRYDGNGLATPDHTEVSVE